MKGYWPPLPSPKGFSIRELIGNLKEKVSEKSFFDTKSVILGNGLIPQFSNSSKLHWANRDFREEYSIL